MKSWIENVPLLRQGLHKELLTKVQGLRRDRSVHPSAGLEFRALDLLPFADVKVVILGQDPYHGPGQAHGLAFSVPQGTKTPPSLRNIFKEVGASVYDDETRTFPTDLTRWASQGVLLLNTVLTVEEGRAGAHRGLGWQILTDGILTALAQGREGLVFMLWGNDARSRSALIDDRRHLVLEAAHPSPLSAYRGFLGCGHFVRANDYLQELGAAPVCW
ncbi:MAG: uracil-DNA glycosylase [Proteobacteria bacterium]|nr:uracil-DNA glycosylase [Pseudomonadota bacterium]